MTKLSEQSGPYFGEFGGRFVPESLIAALDELESTYQTAKSDPDFPPLTRLGKHCTSVSASALDAYIAKRTGTLAQAA